ncbi:MAG: hypothetical protein U9O85_08245 [Euryarchaeota archaeon]|nr:hypothetical protein [Euryarchaeota archaeon]
MSILIKNVLVEGREKNIYIGGNEIAAISEAGSSKVNTGESRTLSI